MSDSRLNGIYAVLDQDIYGDELVSAAQALAAGGIRIFQYRAKSGGDRRTVTALLALTRPANALLIINDDYDLALLADGLHIGQDDIDADRLARFQKQKPNAIIGGSAHAEQHIVAAPFASYFGIGPLRESTSKATRPPLGIAGIAALAQYAQRPVCAIGGIKADDLTLIRREGIAMAACIAAFAGANNRETAAREFIHIWRTAQ